MRNQNHLAQPIVVLCLGALSFSAQACGYTGGAGIEGLFSFDNPFDIAILAVLFGAVCALAPGVLRRMGVLRRAPG